MAGAGITRRQRAGREPLRIRAAGIRTSSDSGQTQAWVEWNDGARTTGDPNSAHMQALLERARREGVNVRLGEVW